MKQLMLTGLGNEVDLNTGKTVFTAIFNNSVRIEISKEAAEVLTSSIFGMGNSDPNSDYSQPPLQAKEEERELEIGYATKEQDLVIEDTPRSIYEEDTGVEQV